MKFFVSLILTLFCACFVFGQEKELPQAEIQKMYIDYFYSEIDAVKGLNPDEKAELYACADSAIKTYHPIPNKGNNTLRKLNFFKKIFCCGRVFSQYNHVEKFNAEQKRLYLEVIQKSITFFTHLLMTHKLIDEEKNKAMDAVLMNFEKNMVKALMKMLKRDKNLDYDIKRLKEWIQRGRESWSISILAWATDTSYATIKWKQLQNVDYSFFEKNRNLLLPMSPFSYESLLKKRLNIDYHKMKDQNKSQCVKNMGLTLSEYTKKFEEIEQLHRKIYDYNKPM